MCIYKFVNTVNGKIYVGKTQGTLGKRMLKHSYHVRKKTNRYVYDAINHYGWDVFSIEILEICDTVDKLNEREIYWIAELKTRNKEFGYNMTEGGDGGGDAKALIEFAKNRIGVPMPEEQKKKISKANKGRSPHPMTAEIKEKISKATKGKMPSKPIHKIIKARGLPPSMLGKKHTEEAKKLISLHHDRKCHIPDNLLKEMSENWMGAGNPLYIHIDKSDLESSIIEGLSIKEMAKKFNVSKQTVWSKINSMLGFSGLIEARNVLLGQNKKLPSSLTAEQVKQIKKKLANGAKQKDLAREYGMSNSVISNIARGVSWKDI